MSIFHPSLDRMESTMRMIAIFLLALMAMATILMVWMLVSAMTVRSEHSHLATVEEDEREGQIQG